MTTRIHAETGIPIEVVADWPWAKRAFYAECYDAIEPDYDELEGPGGDAWNVPGGGSLPDRMAVRDNVVSVNDTI